MSDELVAVSPDWAKRAYVDDAKYKTMYDASVKDPVAFWGEHGKRVDWIKPYSPGAVRDVDYTGDVRIRWFHDGVLNVSANCIDRHLSHRADQVAIIWEGDDPAKSKKITYRELHGEVSRMANALKELGVKKGDRVTIYLPMIPEAAYAMLACTRIGAVHSVVFGGFSPDSLANRIVDCESTVVITADEGLRGGKPVPLKVNTDEAIKKAPGVKKVLVVKHTGGKVAWDAGRDVWWHEIKEKVSAECKPEPMGAENWIQALPSYMRRDETSPSVSVCSRPSGLPMTTACSPTTTSSELPSDSGVASDREPPSTVAARSIRRSARSTVASSTSSSAAS